MKTLLSMVAISGLLFATPLLAQSQGAIAYLFPDIGAAGTNTLVEIIAPASATGSFGSDGFYLNNPGGSVVVRCLNSDDSDKIKFGPTIVNWNGREISTQVFVMPGVAPNSANWTELLPDFRIPLEVVSKGVSIGVDTFYLVRPQPALHILSSGELGSGGAFGFRSRRGAMIVESISVDAPIDSLSVSTVDCDPWTPGNQGYLPLTFICLGRADFSNCHRLEISGRLTTGGPGGGGGGAAFADVAPDPSNMRGGDGFVGGQGGTLQGGDGTGSAGLTNSHGGISLNGVPGPRDVSGSDRWNNGFEGGQGTGGGTGFCFGTSGEGNRTQNCSLDNCRGGYGGGSGASECCCDVYAAWTAFGSGGAGYATEGTSMTSGEGHVYGNASLTPLSGGSGGGGGNPWAGVSGYGGGGGGAMLLYGALGLSNLTWIAANGSDGGDQTLQSPGIYSGAGGGGSGGAVICASKQKISSNTITVHGGRGGVTKIKNPRAPTNVQDGGNGGAGRVRVDGTPTTMTAITAEATVFVGPSTDTSRFVQRSFSLTGTGDGKPIHIYLRGEHTPWSEVATVSKYAFPSWSANISLPGNDTIYFLSASQDIPNPQRSTFVSDPEQVFSQAAANILITHGGCSTSVLQFPQQLVRGHVGQSLSYALHIQLFGVNGDSLLRKATRTDYEVMFDPAFLQVQAVIPPSGWLVQSQSISTDKIEMGLVRATGATHTLDSIGQVLFNVISASKKNTVLKLSAFSITDSAGPIAFCPFEGEGNAWVILLDSLTSGVESVRRQFEISSVYPNPANNNIGVDVELDHEATVSLSMFDVLGREVHEIRKELRAHAGRSSIELNTCAAINGVYFVRVESEGRIAMCQIHILH